MTGLAANQERTEFGFTATTCACKLCIRQCEHISGMLVPSDLARWRAHFGAKENTELARLLLASPGALVGDGTRTWRIQTIVPDRTRTGSCVFLSSEKRCTIHSVAPFGCRFFSDHGYESRAEQCSRAGLTAILEDWLQHGPYSTLWCDLQSLGRLAEAPEVLRGNLHSRELRGKALR
jgi:Fe-S-cluster containining protein